jgi:predicted metal-dependent hydrolase
MLSLLFAEHQNLRQSATDKQQFDLEVNGQTVPVRIITERRVNSRVTLNNKGILLRLSKDLSAEERRKQVEHFMKWAKEKISDRPQLLQNLPVRKYLNDEILQVGIHTFRISKIYQESKSSTARMGGQNISLMISKGLTASAEEECCSYLVSRCLIRYFQPMVEKRIRELNELHFKKQIKSVKLKYNVSNWGSCHKQKGEINISVRLMFAPEKVIDYVYIHELSHLIEANHSARFWQIVEQIMPDYQSAEKHLSEHNLKYYL